MHHTTDKQQGDTMNTSTHRNFAEMFRLLRDNPAELEYGELGLLEDTAAAIITRTICEESPGDLDFHKETWLAVQTERKRRDTEGE